MDALIVDDEEPIRAFVSRVLGDAGYETVIAGSAAEALEQAARRAYDVVVTDVNMPEMSGPQFVELLRRREPDVKVLYLTGYSDQLFTERKPLWEDEAFLDKPCSVNGLLEAVSLLVHGRLPAAKSA